jgi:hypothetical protein
MQKLILCLWFMLISISLFGQDNSQNGKGFIITAKGDTLFGEFLKVNGRYVSYQGVNFKEKLKAEKIYNPADLQYASVEGLVYKTIHYSKNGVISGVNMPGKKLVTLIYASPAIEVYLFGENGEYIYAYPGVKGYKYYIPFTKDDAANYMTNYNKKLEAVFANCDTVKEKIKSGEYKLKAEDSSGHIRAFLDYENACGSKEVERHFEMLSKEKIASLYK